MLRIFAKHFYLYMSYEIDQIKLSERIIAIAKKVSITAGLYIFLTFIIVLVIYSFGLIAVIGSPDELIKMSNQKNLDQFMVANATPLLILNTVVTIALHYFLGGIYGMIKKVETQPYATLGNAFGTIFSKEGLKVLNVIILLQLITTTASYFLDFAGFALVGLGISILLQFLTYFTIPAIYIDGLSIRKSIDLSVKTVNQKPAFLFFFIAFAYFLSFIGILFFGLGIILTLPLNYIVAYSLYTHIKEQV
ncbi:hypothetical protein [Paenimyroides viscosum]|jgi:hypothetical protein|uniref:DUF975 family protein n=1 Tax=Paenimyroides viscosum TaxID=2488729 RepID=A0A3P1AWU0_9FLAO|nr:hypothetical protein [Paenimyroides viscosum]RRA93277.1 hypothetical protein EG242_10760 [Paenimyroides viscosum]